MRAERDDSRGMAVGLDLGSTKVAAVIAEQDDLGPIKVIGAGSSPSEGLRKGAVVDVEKTVEAVRRALEAAALMAGASLPQVYAGIGGEQIASGNSHGVVAVGGSGGEVAAEDKDRVIEAARAISVAPGREVLHVLPQQYYIDGQAGIRDPVGIAGVRLEVDVHLVTGSATAVQNIRHSIVRAGYQVQELVLEPLAASWAVLSEDEREMGVCLVDIGGDTTNVVLYSDNCIHHTSVIGLGGQNATNDLAMGLRTSSPLAEQLKRESGAALASQVGADEVVEVPGIAGRAPKPVPRQQIASIIGARMEEIFGLVQANLQASGVSLPPPAGVVLTGGGALVPGIADLAEQLLRTPARVSAPNAVSGLSERVSSPVWATALGLVCYGLMRQGAGGRPGGGGKAEGPRVQVPARVPWWRALRDRVMALV